MAQSWRETTSIETPCRILTAAQREAMSDATVVEAVIDWARLRDQALLPLRAGESATFQPYDWDADDGRLALPKTIPAADVIIVDGVYAARPELADLVDLAVYLGVDPQTRADRYTARDEDPELAAFLGARRGVLLQRRPPSGRLLTSSLTAGISSTDTPRITSRPTNKWGVSKEMVALARERGVSESQSGSESAQALAARASMSDNSSAAIWLRPSISWPQWHRCPSGSVKTYAQNWHRMLGFQHKREDAPWTAAAIFDHHNAAAGSRWLEEA